MSSVVSLESRRKQTIDELLDRVSSLRGTILALRLRYQEEKDFELWLESEKLDNIKDGLITLVLEKYKQVGVIK